MRALIVDDDDLILEFLRICLEDSFPGVEVTEYQSAELGRPGADFDWSTYDLLLLDYNLGNGENGVDWLQSFGGGPGFPQTILITAINEPRVVAKAVKCGADGYLNKSEMTVARLVATVRDVLQGPLARQDESKRTAVVRPDGSVRVAGQVQKRVEPGEIEVGTSYRFGRCIGKGGMSRVYLAERVSDHATVVIKILDRRMAKDPELLQRFRMEGALIEEIDSPYVVNIFERGITNSYDYLVMEFFGRGDLAQQIEQGISPRQALAYLYHIACGLKAIHSVGVVHRDLKPANIMFRADGSIALADFGIAKRLDTDLALTETGGILGTLHYMSPEQAHSATADPRSDLYSVGVIFYEMLTGRRPYNGNSASAMLMHHLHGPVPELEGDLGCYQPLLHSLMCKDIAQRMPSAEALILALHDYAQNTDRTGRAAHA
jgi:DNA-binding NarL/FixJ family response regulator/tRNA A-37 threonylcarbamoyl transferase component Bud32